ncbi:MAG: type II secretion system F family protein [Chthoniobacteraceae bacterium]|jgi:type II secretory pathway component PulF
MNRLTIGEKHEFYAGLARLVRSGNPLPSALDLLERNSSRGLRGFLRDMNARVKQGEPLGDALLQMRPAISDLEAGIIGAAGRSGKLDHGCEQLSRYFESLDRARKQIIARSMYPLVMLHLIIPMAAFGIVRIESLMQMPGTSYVWLILIPFAVLYGAAAALWLLWRALSSAARSSAAADTFLSRIPGLGAVRDKFALARFFTTLEAQLEAQVNVWDAFASAAKTSDSGRIIAAARQAMPMLQSGERLGEALAMKNVIPEEYINSFRIAEQAGELDAELSLLAQRSEENAIAVLDRWSEWLPKIIYVGVLLCGASLIVIFYSKYFGGITRLLDSSPQ